MTRRRVAGIITLLTGLIVVTPFCGVLFSCGCEWPWSGLEKFCNVHDPRTVHQCPWCISLFAGGMSFGVALLLGYKAALFGLPQKFGIIPAGEVGGTSTVLNSLMNTVFGIVVFFAVTLVAGWLSAKLFHYPGFLG